MTPPRYITPTDLLSTPWTDPPPSTIHIISEIERIQGWLPELKEVRQKLGEEGKRWEPRIVWEPEPVSVVSIDTVRASGCGMCARLETRFHSSRGVEKDVMRAELAGQYDCVPSHLEAFATLVPKVDIFRRVSPASCPRAELPVISPIRAAVSRGSESCAASAHFA